MKVNTKINDILLKCVDDLSKYHMFLNSPLYWDINVFLYSVAITSLHKRDQLREIKPIKSKPKFP